MWPKSELCSFPLYSYSNFFLIKCYFKILNFIDHQNNLYDGQIKWDAIFDWFYISNLLL